MKRVIVLSAVTFLVILVLTITLGFSRYVKGKIEDGLAESCPPCEFKIDSLHINGISGTALAHFITFATDPKDKTTVKVKAYHVEIKVKVSELLKHKIVISSITLKDFKVTIEEKYDDREEPPNEEKLKELEASYGGKLLESLPEAVVESISLENGTLQYVMKKFGKDAIIKVSEINAQISTLATRKELGPRYVNADLTGKLQESGQVTFKLNADLFSVKNEDKISIGVRNQKMSELDIFFMNEDGILMSGEINDIHATVKLEQGVETGDLWANYHDLKLEVKPTPDTGALKAALTNVLQKIKIATTKPEPGKPDPHVDVNYHRIPNQGIVKFILMGLKDAALKAASN